MDLNMMLKAIQAILSQYNSLGNGRYFDTASETSFEVDHAAQVCLAASLSFQFKH